MFSFYTNTTHQCSKECQAKDWQDGKHWEHCFLSIDNEAVASDPTLGAKNNTIPSNTDAPTTASATSTHTTSNRNANLVDLNDPFLFAKAPVGIQPESPTMSSNSIAAKIHNNHSMHIPGLITSKKAISNENMKNLRTNLYVISSAPIKRKSKILIEKTAMHYSVRCMISQT